MSVPGNEREKRIYRAAVIRRTGNGGYGHGLDQALMDCERTQVIAVADDNPEGLEQSGERLRVKARYQDYHDMLDKERPDIVAVCPRWLDVREEMVTACAEAGAHVYCEKPFTRSLDEADRILETCAGAKPNTGGTSGVKIAMAHPYRVMPGLQRARQMLYEGAIGRPLYIRGMGKGDRRGGGEDLLTLGDHILDAMRYIAGDVAWAFAHVRVEGRDAGAKDIAEATEPVGPVAGDSVAAIYGFEGAAHLGGPPMHGYFESYRGIAETGRRMGFEIYGSDGIISVRSVSDKVYVFRGNPSELAQARSWEPVTPTADLTMSDPEREKIVPQESMRSLQLRVVEDFVSAIDSDSQPISSGYDGRAAIEMITAVYASHIARARVEFPVKERRHPLVVWKG